MSVDRFLSDLAGKLNRMETKLDEISAIVKVRPTADPPVVPPPVTAPPVITPPAVLKPPGPTIHEIRGAGVVPSTINGIHMERYPLSAEWLGPPLRDAVFPYGFVRNHTPEFANMADIYRHSDEGNFDNLKRWSGFFARKGVPIFWSFYGTPTRFSMFPEIRSRWGSWPGAHAMPRSLAQYKEKMLKVLEVMRAEGAKVQAVAGINEPDEQGRNTQMEPWGGGKPPFWLGTVTGNMPAEQRQRLVDLVIFQKAVWEVAQEFDPTMDVYGPEFVWWDENGNRRREAVDWYVKWVDMDTSVGPARQFMNAIAAHHYSSGRSGIRSFADKIAAVRATRDAVNPAWKFGMTEVGILEGVNLSPEIHADLVRRRLMLAAVHGASTCLHWKIDHSHSYNGHPQDNKVAADAFRFGQSLVGANLVAGAEMTDGSIWLADADGKEFRG